MIKTIMTTLAVGAMFTAPVFASGKPAGVGNSGHVDTWHGTGSDHQANNEPGDTASDRHNFDAAATPGGTNPTDEGNGDGNG